MFVISRKWPGPAASAIMAAFGAVGQAQAAFPDRPITVIVLWAAGGGTDAVARCIAAVMQGPIRAN